MMRNCIQCAAVAVVAWGCDAPAPPPSTGGVDGIGDACGRGLVVVSTDYQSTNVSLLDRNGTVLSSSFLSSGSAQSGLSAALSGDVVVPTSRWDGDDVVLIDRYPASVLTFVDLATGVVRAQLDVSTGFAANPHDFLVVGEGRGYVSRYGANPQPDQETFDEGNDVLSVDIAEPSVVGRIDMTAAMSDAPQFLPRADRMVSSSDYVFVLLGAYSADFKDSASARLVAIDPATDSIIGVTVLDGLRECAALDALEDTIAVACSGKFGGGATPSTAEAGVAVLDVEPDGRVVERTRWRVDQLNGQPLGFSVALVDRNRLLVTTLGSSDLGTRDALLDIGTDGRVDTVIESQQPFELGDVRCLHGAGCAQRCYLADAEQGRVHKLELAAVPAQVVDSIAVDETVGLPPRRLGHY